MGTTDNTDGHPVHSLKQDLYHALNPATANQPGRKLPEPIRASDMRVVEYEKGDVFQISNPMHEFAGKTGTLEFHMGGAAWLQIAGESVPVKVTEINLVRKAGGKAA